MFTQTIKRWLNKLFAWLPWGRSSVTNYPQIVSMNTPGTPEQVWRTTMNGPATQPGVASVAVEHGPQDDTPDVPRLTTDSERQAHASPSLSDEQRSSSSLSPPIRSNDTPTIPSPHRSAENELPPFVLQHRRLEFLRYLVQRGIVNEDFPEGQAPDQYYRQQD